MGRSKLFRTGLSFMLVLSMSFQTVAQSNDGLKPIQPSLDEDQWIDDPGKGTDDLLPPPDSRNPKKPKVRPDNSTRGFKIEAAKVSVADVGEEFECPMFENKAYQGVIDALNKLNEAMKSSVQCPQAPSMTQVADNTKQIKEAVDNLQPVLENPETAFGQIKAFEENISKAILGVDGLVSTLANPAFVQSACGEQFYASTGALGALSNIVTNLGPFALLGISLAPGLGVAVKASAIAVVAGASAVTEYQKLVYGRTLQMTNHEHWKAIVQNTCAYSRVARKLNYIHRYSSGLIPAVEDNNKDAILPEEIQKKTLAFNKLYMNRQDQLGQKIKLTLQNQTKFGQISYTITKGLYEVNRLASEIGDYKTSPDIACSVGRHIARLAQRTSDKPAFPNDLIQVSDEFRVYDKVIDITPLISTYQLNIRALSAVQEESLLDTNALASCAARSMSLIDTLRKIANNYNMALKEIEREQEAALMKDPAYREWKTQFVNLEKQKIMGQQLYNAMRALERSRDPLTSTAAIYSYLHQRQTGLKYILLGSPGWGRNPPVYLWLDYTLSLHKQAITNMKKNISLLQQSSYQLILRQRKDKGLPTKVSSFEINKQLHEDYQRALKLEGLDVSFFDMKNSQQSREQQMVCQRLLNTWDSWVEAVNHLDAVGMFCNMIDPLIDIATDSSVVKFCRGSNMDVSSFLVRSNQSYVSQAAYDLVSKNANYSNKSLEDMALQLPQIMKAMKCNVAGAR